jgi:hypothetical protein
MHGTAPKYFLNMDQTAVFFESKSQTVVSTKGKTVPSRDSGCNAKRATVVVTIAADGTKLDPFFIYLTLKMRKDKMEMSRDKLKKNNLTFSVL